jgi:cytochrome c5
MRFAAASLTCLLMASARVLAAEPAALSPQQEHGKKVYNGLCVFCHAPGLWGTTTLAKRMDKQHAVLDGRTDLAPATIRVAVRVGIGSMPPLRKTEVTDSDLDAVIAYLTRAGGNR